MRRRMIRTPQAALLPVCKICLEECSNEEASPASQLHGYDKQRYTKNGTASPSQLRDRVVGSHSP